MAKTTKKEPLDKKNNSKAKESTPWVNETAQNRAGQSLILFSVALLVALFLLHSRTRRSKCRF
jgi:S-DNA-T family DNA segregation ATPase FtsK/SpoIIIE